MKWAMRANKKKIVLTNPRKKKKLMEILISQKNSLRFNIFNIRSNFLFKVLHYKIYKTKTILLIRTTYTLEENIMYIVLKEITNGFVCTYHF